MNRVSLFAALLILSGAGDALATYDGPYASLSAGYGTFSGDELVVNETNEDQPIYGEGCCPTGGMALGLRLGWMFLNSVAPELYLVGDGWNLGGDRGGGAFLGGGVRFMPLGLLEQLDVMPSDFPVHLGLGAALGTTLIGNHFAYTGSFFAVDATLEVEATSFLSVGFRLDYARPALGDFVFTDYNGELGRCLDGAARQVGDDEGLRADVEPTCDGRGPSTGFFSPSLVLTFHFLPS